ncbi:MAG TPA: thioesterase family protein [Anaeromyxobacteraceae bacterium]|nr:thioesterase family protein [Anaeromyxobacteraceae bacterium]
MTPGPAFYEPLGEGRYRATTATVGPWSPGLQHGGPPSALLAHVLERVAPRSGARIARLSVEILGPVEVAEMRVSAAVERPGRRVQLLSARAEIGGREALRATAWQVLAEPGRSPECGPREPAPAFPGQQPQVFFPNVPTFPYGEALEWRFTEGGFDRVGPATAWARCRIPIVAGEPLTGLQRIAVMVDSANGVSWEVPLGAYTFVPVDLNVVLHREPAGEWVCMAATTTVEPDGVGMVRTRLFDAAGQVGGSLHTLFVAPR